MKIKSESVIVAYLSFHLFSGAKYSKKDRKRLESFYKNASKADNDWISGTKRRWLLSSQHMQYEEGTCYVSRLQKIDLIARRIPHEVFGVFY